MQPPRHRHTARCRTNAANSLLTAKPRLSPILFGLGRRLPDAPSEQKRRYHGSILQRIRRSLLAYDQAGFDVMAARSVGIGIPGHEQLAVRLQRSQPACRSLKTC